MKTISDFGAQWTRYPDNEGYYASQAMLADICGPLLDPAEVRGLNVAELGSGTGRIVLMLLEAGAAHVTAVEPSAAFEPLASNTAPHGARVRLVRATADQLPGGPYDLVVSFGVLHHIADPQPALRRAYERLKPGGHILVWVYGLEGNRLYLALVRPLRALTRKLPDWLLVPLCNVLTAGLTLYALTCRILPLPMRAYMREVIARYGWKHRYLTVFDQLNPDYARYYSENEARDLLARAGFREVVLYHRHGYSWTVRARKTAAAG